MYETIEQLAVRYRVSTDTIKRWVRLGRFPTPTHVEGKRKLWDLDVVNSHSRVRPVGRSE